MTIIDCLMNFINESPYATHGIKLYTRKAMTHQMASQLSRLYPMPLPPGMTMTDVVPLMPHTEDLNTLHAILNEIIVDGTSSPHFSTALTIIGQGWG